MQFKERKSFVTAVSVPCPYYALCCTVLTLWDFVDCSPPGSSVHRDSPGKNTGAGCHASLQENAILIVIPTGHSLPIAHSSQPWEPLICFPPLWVYLL